MTTFSSSGDARSVFDNLWRTVPLSQDHDLSTRFILFHTSMCLDDLLKTENFADLDAQCIRSDLFNQILKRRPHVIFRFAGIGGQADRTRYRLHWGKIIEGPFVADDPSHAHDAVLFGAAK